MIYVAYKNSISAVIYIILRTVGSRKKCDPDLYILTTPSHIFDSDF